MLSLIAGIIGAIFGWWRASKRGGNRADKLQYAAVHGMAFLVVGYFASLAILSLLG
ncbi:MAG: hypothetical protein V3V13_03660 [Paracoccaceae bacterium]